MIHLSESKSRPTITLDSHAAPAVEEKVTNKRQQFALKVSF